MAPSGPAEAWTSGAARTRLWNAMLAQFGKLVPVTLPVNDRESEIEISQFVQVRCPLAVAVNLQNSLKCCACS